MRFPPLLLAWLCVLAVAPTALAQVVPRCRLLGPQGQLELPPQELLVLHVFAPSCDTYDQEFAALAEHAERGFPCPQVFVAVTVTPEEAHPELEARVERLVYDVGGETLRFPFALQGFSTIIVDPRGFLTRVGHPSQPGFMSRLWTTAESLQDSLALSGSHGPGALPPAPPAAEAGAAPAAAAPVTAGASVAAAAPAAPGEPPSVWAFVAPFLAVGALACLLGRRLRRASRQHLEQVLTLQPGLRCAQCGETLRRHEALVACAGCSGVSHSSCQRAAGGCQTIGCPARPLAPGGRP